MIGLIQKLTMGWVNILGEALLGLVLPLSQNNLGIPVFIVVITFPHILNLSFSLC